MQSRMAVSRLLAARTVLLHGSMRIDGLVDVDASILEVWKLRTMVQKFPSLIRSARCRAMFAVNDVYMPQFQVMAFEPM